MYTNKELKTMDIKGDLIDHETRCTHYHSERDRVAIKFYCCQTYFPCYKCHEAYGCGEATVWPKKAFDHKAVLCGSCGEELTIAEYLQGLSKCPFCQAAFNPNCRLHQHFYFDV